MNNNPITATATPSLYVGDLAPEVDDNDLKEFFSSVGAVMNTRVILDNATRQSKGYGYVNFFRLEDAERSLEALNFQKIKGKTVRMMWSHRDSSLRESGAGNIIIKNLDPSIDTKALHDTFSMFGNILSARVSNTNGVSNGYGFVHFEKPEDAKKAIEEVDGGEIEGKVVKVEMYNKTKKDEKNDTFTNLYVKDLPMDMTQEKLEEIFGKYGEIQHAQLLKDAERKIVAKKTPEQTEADVSSTVTKSCIAYVNYKEAQSAKDAIEGLKDFEIEGKKIYVVRHQTKNERKRNKAIQEAGKTDKRYTNKANLYVKNFGEDVTEEQLREMFKEFGTITSCKVSVDENGKSRKFGFVNFSSHDEATKAIMAMNNKIVGDKPLYVDIFQNKQERKQKIDIMNQRKMAAPMYNNAYMQQPMLMPWNQMGMMHRQPNNFHLMPVQNQRGQQPMRRNNGRQGHDGQRNMMMNQKMNNVRMGQQPQMMNQESGVEADFIKKLANVSGSDRTQMIGERLFPLVKAIEPMQAGKITGMLLEMDDHELLDLLENDVALKERVEEALEVLAQHNATSEPQAAQ